MHVLVNMTLILNTNNFQFEGACVSATIDLRRNELHYNLQENCSEKLHFICEAKQANLYEQDVNRFPNGYKRHKLRTPYLTWKWNFQSWH